MLPNDVTLLLRQVANSGIAPYDIMAEDCLKRYTPQTGPSEVKENVTYGGILRFMDEDGWLADG